jgi:hypothetical protein
MNSKTLIYGAAAFAVAAFAFVAMRRAGGITSAGDAERMAGMDALYAASAGQQAGVQASIAANWQRLGAELKTQPDFWI